MATSSRHRMEGCGFSAPAQRREDRRHIPRKQLPVKDLITAQAGVLLDYQLGRLSLDISLLTLVQIACGEVTDGPPQNPVRLD